MAIEWGSTTYQSDMTYKVLDNTGKAPDDVLQAGDPFRVTVAWQVPAALAPYINAGDSFRLRAFAESIGPGPEAQVGPTVIEPGVPNKINYTSEIYVANNQLVGEGGAFNGQLVSGCYKIVVVLQHLNGAGATTTSGCADDQPLVMFRLP